jgi:hypothetical protein
MAEHFVAEGSEDVVAQWLKMWLNGGKCCGSIVENVVAQ